MKARGLVWALLASILLIGATACMQEPVGPRAWIDFPTNGSSVPAGAPVSIVSHAYAPEGVAEVLLSINGEPYRRSPPAKPGETFSEAVHEWFPQQEGEYVLQVQAFSKNGEASRQAAVRVRAIGKVTRTPTATPTTATPVPLPDLAIVSVEAVIAGYKGTTPFCNTRVTYQNIGVAAVPIDFTIQFHFNGTPQLANTVARGLPPGGTAFIEFVYQFEGTPYIGINLDSTSVIGESNETNNAFAEARQCGGTPPPTPTFTPTSATGTLTPTATATLVTPPPPSGCSGTPIIASFGANPTAIQKGQSAMLTWGAVTNADSVSIEPGIGGVPAPGSRAVSPNMTTTYTLIARCGGNSATQQTTINVTSAPNTHTPTATRTRTPTPRDTQGPPAPNLRSPKGTQPCVGSRTLDWDPVSDPSGIRDYTVKWTRNDGQSGGTVTTGTSHTISVACGKSYTWSVFATDNAGNRGGTGSANFSVEGLH